MAFSPIQGFLSARFFLVLFKRTHALFLRGSNSFTRASNSLYPARMWCAERSRVSWLFRVNPDSLPAVNLAITKSTRRNQANRSQPIISQEISLRSRVWKFYSINSCRLVLIIMSWFHLNSCNPPMFQNQSVDARRSHTRIFRQHRLRWMLDGMEHLDRFGITVKSHWL